MTQQRIAIFGASGSIGLHLCNHFLAQGWRVYGISRRPPPKDIGLSDIHWVCWDPDQPAAPENLVSTLPVLNAVVWAQGMNFNDNIGTVDTSSHIAMYQANVVYVLQTLSSLLNSARLESPARLCVISSIWQNIARQNKLSYCITKSALQGLVLSASVDLAQWGHVINAVLPGALDTPMTRTNLANEQIVALENATLFHKLPSLNELAATVEFLCSPHNTGMTGQFIAVDKGFSHARIL